MATQVKRTSKESQTPGTTVTFSSLTQNHNQKVRTFCPVPNNHLMRCTHDVIINQYPDKTLTVTQLKKNTKET